MFMSAMILMRLTIAGPMSAGSVSTSWSAPSMRNRTRTCVALRLDVDVGGAVAQRLREDEVDDLDDRRVLVDRPAAAPARAAAASRGRTVSSNSLMWCATSASAR